MSTNAAKIFNNETSSKASSFLSLIASFQLIVTLVISTNILDLTLPVTELLQARAIDIMGTVAFI